MSIWILALVLLAAGVGMGLRLGAIITACSFVAIIIATFFAHLVGKLFKPIIAHLVGVNPPLVWALPSIVGFFIVYIALMAVGFEVHRRVGVYYKYKAGDLRLALWERLDNRVGGCLGVLNGTAWLILISFFFFNLSYWTAQVGSSENEPKWVRVSNDLGYGMQSTGLDKAARAVGSIPDWYYRTANFAGLIMQNPRVTALLRDYPAFISLTENSDIQALSQDGGLVQAWNSGGPLNEIYGDSQVQSIIKNTNLCATIWNTVQSDMDDITNYVITGKSPKFDSQKIIGRWEFDVVPALGALLESQPKIRPNELKAIRAVWTQAFAQTTFIAGSDGQAFLKSVPDFKKNPPETDNWTGNWSTAGTNYDLTLSLNSQTKVASAQTDGLRLKIKMGQEIYVFQRTY